MVQFGWFGRPSISDLIIDDTGTTDSNPLAAILRVLAISSDKLIDSSAIQSIDMTTLPEVSALGSLFQSALEDYEKQTAINPVQHPLAIQLEGCSSVESVTEVLEYQARAFREFQGNSKIMTLLKNAVQILHKLSATVVHGEDIGPVCLKSRYSSFYVNHSSSAAGPTCENDIYQYRNPPRRRYLRISYERIATTFRCTGSQRRQCEL